MTAMLERDLSVPPFEGHVSRNPAYADYAFGTVASAAAATFAGQLTPYLTPLIVQTPFSYHVPFGQAARGSDSSLNRGNSTCSYWASADHDGLKKGCTSERDSGDAGFSVQTSPVLRGPPEKPRRSGYAIWVGNLSSSATVLHLRDRFSIGATDDILSVFLILKSGCAFVNYRTEQAAIEALMRFHGSILLGKRLFCRLRNDSSSYKGSLSSPGPSMQSPLGSSSAASAGTSPTSGSVEEEMGPLIVGGNSSSSKSSSTNVSPDRLLAITPERFFILKSLAVSDLLLSQRSGTWSTQQHNESMLNAAFIGSKDVYLFFSANRSGEFSGYARMISSIRARHSHGTGTPIEPTVPHGPSRCVLAPATDVAPGGRIVNDANRGVVFWEVTAVSEDGTSSPGSCYEYESTPREFAIEWLSTTRLPFHHVRGLRNPWNGHREVKIARDGTEVPPDVGRCLMRMME